MTQQVCLDGEMKQMHNYFCENKKYSWSILKCRAEGYKLVTIVKSRVFLVWIWDENNIFVPFRMGTSFYILFDRSVSGFEKCKQTNAKWKKKRNFSVLCAWKSSKKQYHYHVTTCMCNEAPIEKSFVFVTMYNVWAKPKVTFRCQETKLVRGYGLQSDPGLGVAQT